MQSKRTIFFLILFVFGILIPFKGKHTFAQWYNIFQSEEKKELSNQLVFWQFWDQKWLEPALQKFQQQNPEITIKLERLTWTEGLNKIITSMAANQAPDIIEIGSTWVGGLSSDGGLKPIQIGELKNKLVNWEPARFKGKYYAVPWTVSTGAIYYNKNLLKRAKITTFPKDWNELFAASKKINELESGISGYGIKTGIYSTWQKFLPYAWSNGARLLTEKGTGVNSESFREAVSFYKKLRPFSLYDDNDVVRKAFQDGNLGFIMEEPGQIQKFKKESPTLIFGVEKLPVSPNTGKSVNFSGGQMLAITKNSKKVKQAEKFIKFLVQIQNTKLITSRVTTLFPAHKSAKLDDFYQKEHPELLVFLETLETATAPLGHPKWIEIQEVFSENLERVMYEKASVEEAMKKAEDEINEILYEVD